MKRAFSSFQKITHLWANQTQSDARSPNGHFEGPSIYSYGTHYLAGHLHDRKGIKVAVINSERYSNTTSKHTSLIRQALPESMPYFHGPDPKDLEGAILFTQGELVARVFDTFKGRVYRRYGTDLYFGDLNEPFGLVRDVEKFNESVLSLGYSKYSLDGFDDDFILLLNTHVDLAILKEQQNDRKRNTPEERARKALAEERKLEREALKNGELAKLNLARLNDWLCGGGSFPALANYKPQLIRVRGTNVETSRGASLPLNIVMRSYRRLLNNTLLEGDKIEHFTVETGGYTIVNRELGYPRWLTIGCHVFEVDQIKSVLEKYNTLKAVGDE